MGDSSDTAESPPATQEAADGEKTNAHHDHCGPGQKQVAAKLHAEKSTASPPATLPPPPFSPPYPMFMSQPGCYGGGYGGFYNPCTHLNTMNGHGATTSPPHPMNGAAAAAAGQQQPRIFILPSSHAAIAPPHAAADSSSMTALPPPSSSDAAEVAVAPPYENKASSLTFSSRNYDDDDGARFRRPLHSSTALSKNITVVGSSSTVCRAEMGVSQFGSSRTSGQGGMKEKKSENAQAEKIQDCAAASLPAANPPPQQGPRILGIFQSFPSHVDNLHAANTIVQAAARNDGALASGIPLILGIIPSYTSNAPPLQYGGDRQKQPQGPYIPTIPLNQALTPRAPLFFENLPPQILGTGPTVPVAPGVAIPTTEAMRVNQESGPRIFIVKKRKKRHYNHESFPNRLHRLLRESKEKGNEKVARFTDDGMRWEILHTKNFEALLPNYFRHGNINSFKRLLRMYGFKRIQGTWMKGTFGHPLFQRNSPELCNHISRRGTHGDE